MFSPVLPDRSIAKNAEPVVINLNDTWTGDVDFNEDENFTVETYSGANAAFGVDLVDNVLTITPYAITTGRDIRDIHVYTNSVALDSFWVYLINNDNSNTPPEYYSFKVTITISAENPLDYDNTRPVFKNLRDRIVIILNTRNYFNQDQTDITAQADNDANVITTSGFEVRWEVWFKTVDVNVDMLITSVPDGVLIGESGVLFEDTMDLSYFDSGIHLSPDMSIRINNLHLGFNYPDLTGNVRNFSVIEQPNSDVSTVNIDNASKQITFQHVRPGYTEAVIMIRDGDGNNMEITIPIYCYTYDGRRPTTTPPENRPDSADFVADTMADTSSIEPTRLYQDNNYEVLAEFHGYTGEISVVGREIIIQVVSLEKRLNIQELRLGEIAREDSVRENLIFRTARDVEGRLFDWPFAEE